MPQEAVGPKIVCVALNPAIDRTLEVHNLEVGQHAKGRLLSRQPAGKAVNVARVLQHLGQPCLLTGFVGEAERAMFERSFDADVVTTQLFGLDCPTRENISLADPDKGIETHVRDEGSEVREDDQRRLARKLKILAKPDRWMVFAGSLPRGLGPERFLEILGTVTSQGTKLILDSSEAAREVLRRVPLWLIKPNVQELSALTGRDVRTQEEIVSAARALREAADTVLVSAGEKGCYLVESGAVLHGYMKKLSQRVTNTVGCGDALLAGFLAARLRGQQAKACVELAVAAGTSAAFQIHAGEIDAVETELLARRVTVETLSG